MKKFAILVATFFVMGWAHGAQTNNGCQGNCPSDGGGSNATATGGNGYGTGIGMGGQGGSGGSGGQGGAGGNASSIANGGQGGIGLGGMGGSVAGSGNSANNITNRNDNLNTQGQNQGQGQSQSNKQGQSQSANNSQSSRNDNRSQASNANSNASQGNTTSTAVNVAGDQVTYQAARIPVATAYAPNIAPTALCALGVSAGVQGMSVGVSIGGSYVDTNCQQLEQVRTVSAVLGDRESAAEMMCGISEAYREARATTGKPCGSRANLGKPQAVAAVQQTKPDQYQDPIIRARLGLPPLK